MTDTSHSSFPFEGVATCVFGAGGARCTSVSRDSRVHVFKGSTLVTKSQDRRKVRLSRALGIPLTPKAAKYLEKRPYAPGEHGRTKRKADSDYAVRLREKQRLREQYGIREKQLRIVFNEARRTQGLTGENLVELLEMRLDALVLRAAFARTTAQARQMVVHRHILVDGQLVDRPSFRVKPGQTIHVKERSEGTEPFQVAAAGGHVDVLPKTPGYLDVQLDKLQATLLRRPKRAEVPVTAEVQLVVEYYAAR
jgi:small subunit ribosomal protein S4